MKQWAIKLIIVLTITGVTTGYYFKTRNQEVVLDQYINNLQEIKKILSPVSRITLYTDSFSSDLLIRCRYSLAPIIVARDYERNSDTLLYALSVSKKDTTLLNKIHQQTIISRCSDSHYHYYLVASH